MLKCKFKVERVAKIQNARELVLSATSKTEGDNQDWSKYTPSGEVKLIVTNESAWPQIDSMAPGDLYYIDIRPVEITTA